MHTICAHNKGERRGMSQTADALDTHVETARAATQDGREDAIDMHMRTQLDDGGDVALQR